MSKSENKPTSFGRLIVLATGVLGFIWMAWSRSGDSRELAEPSIERSPVIERRQRSQTKSNHSSIVRENGSGDAVIRKLAKKELSDEEAWVEIENLSYSASTKKADQRLILRRIAKARGAVGAIDFLNSRIGPGTLRCSLISSVFSDASNNLDDAVKALSLLEYPNEELDYAIEGMASSYRMNGQTSIDINQVIQKVPSALVPKIASAAIFALGRQDGDSHRRQDDAVGIFNAISNSEASEPERQSAMAEVFKVLVSDFPMGAWGILSAHSNDPPAFMKESAGHMISQMASENPKLALGSILEYSGKEKMTFVEDAAYRIARRNMSDVTDVLGQLPELNQPNARDAFAAGVLRFSVESGDLETAKLWLDTIEDAKLKEKSGKLLMR